MTACVVVMSLMILSWAIHMAVVWKRDFKAWYHDSDNDI